jgi:hypothetical protein
MMLLQKLLCGILTGERGEQFWESGYGTHLRYINILHLVRDEIVFINLREEEKLKLHGTNW